MIAGHDFSAALRVDGRAFAWGWHHEGQLGDGTYDDRRKAVRVQLGNVASLSAGYTNCLATRSSGTGWAWGNNEDGQVGRGVKYVTSRPVRVLAPRSPEAPQALAVPTSATG